MLYINDVFKMMLWFWGFPAFRMTKASLDNDENEHCRFLLEIDPGMPGNDTDDTVLLTHLGKFIKLIFVVGEVTPIFWVTFFTISFICHQHARFSYDPLDYHNESAEQRRKLQLDHINQSN